jgi:hypothetical protein
MKAERQQSAASLSSKLRAVNNFVDGGEEYLLKTQDPENRMIVLHPCELSHSAYLGLGSVGGCNF